MILNNQIHPLPDNIKKLVSTYPKGKPVVMVNIVRLKTRIDEGAESGAEAYARYGRNVLPFLKKAGGRLVWRGRVHQTIIGDEDSPPHLIFMVRYPSVDHFISMVSDPGYAKIARDRTIAIEYGGLLATMQEYPPEE